MSALIVIPAVLCNPYDTVQQDVSTLHTEPISRLQLPQQTLSALGFFTLRNLRAINRMFCPGQQLPVLGGPKTYPLFLAISVRPINESVYQLHAHPRITEVRRNGTPVTLRFGATLKGPVRFRLTGSNPSTCPYPLHCDVSISDYGSPLPGTDQSIRYISCCEGG